MNPIPIIAVLILGAFTAILNQTLLNVALPKIMTDLNVSYNTVQWLVTGYMLVNGVLIPVTAFLMETFSTRKLFLFAMISFGVGTILCALSPTFTILLVGRLIQGIGAGIIMPLMTNVMLTVFPPEKRGVAMGTMGVAMIFAPAVGPTLSGWIVENYTWRILFYVVLPFIVVDIILTLIFLKNIKKLTFPKLDLLGFILSTAGFGGILYAFSEAGNKGWGSGEVILSLSLGILSLVLFVWREYAVKYPMLEFRVFKYNIFALTTVVSGVITMAMFAGMILLPIYLQNIRGFTPLQSGLLLLPGAIIMGIMSPITGMLYDRVGARPLAIVGLIITIITTWQFATLTDATTYGHIMVLYTFRMFGMSMLMMPIMTEGLNQLPPHLHSHGTAMANTMRQVAGSLGTAFLVTVMSNRSIFHQAGYTNSLTASNHFASNQLQALGQGVGASMHLPTGTGSTLINFMLYGQVVKESTIQGINDAFVVATGLAALALVLSFFVKRSVKRAPKPSAKKSRRSGPPALAPSDELASTEH
ncbi:MAG TPA: DHA2 family efflux MFS transporter permease subunit [Candidatus Angelobacter sp.]|nr:DHA2 family efflux MFS transporter permease subunit [Candidatus Angelobacter sp.]